MKIVLRFLVFGLFFACPFCLAAQDTTLLSEEIEQLDESGESETEEPEALPSRQVAPVALRPVENAQWDKAAGALDYRDDQPKKVEKPAEKKKRDRFEWNPDWAFWGKLLQVLAIVVAVLGIGFAIYRLMQEPKNRQIARDGAEITLDNLEEYLHESDLDRFLRESLAAGQFTSAVRIYYLQVIKHLSERNAIQWSREKTNRDYLLEMRPHRLFAEFRDATRAYERIWYGNVALDAQGFADLEPKFKHVLEK